MAYRKTEKVLAQLEAKRANIVASAIDVIAKSGMEGFTTDLVAKRAGVANGLMYHYFPDRDELLATVTAHLLARDIVAMQEAWMQERSPLAMLATALTVFFDRMEQPNLVRAMADRPAYRMGIRAELEKLIRAVMLDLTPRARTLAAAAALGALYGAFDVTGGSKGRASVATAFALRGIGVSDALARKVLARHSLATVHAG